MLTGLALPNLSLTTGGSKDIYVSSENNTDTDSDCDTIDFALKEISPVSTPTKSVYKEKPNFNMTTLKSNNLGVKEFSSLTKKSIEKHNIFNSIVPTQPVSPIKFENSPRKNNLFKLDIPILSRNESLPTQLITPGNNSVKANIEIDKYQIRKLLVKTNYKTGEWPSFYNSRLVKMEITRNKTKLINLLRHNINNLLNGSKIIMGNGSLKFSLPLIVKDFSPELFVVANLWYLWYEDRFYDDEDPDFDYVKMQLNRKYYNLVTPKSDSCEYNYLLNSFIILRRKRMRGVYYHDFETDLKPDNKPFIVLWENIALPILYSITRNLFRRELIKPCSY